MMRKGWHRLGLMLVLLVGMNVYGNKTAQIMTASDSLPVLHPHYAPAPLRSKYNGKAFVYEEAQETESLWNRLMQYLKQKLIRDWGVFDIKSWKKFWTIVRLTFYFLVFGMAVYFFVKIITREGIAPITSGSDTSFGTPVADEKLMQNPQRLPTLIRRAEQQGQWRLALRYRFLHLLHQLDNAGKIRWQPYKTNRDYLRELKEENLKKDFRLLSRVYDYYWFGHYPLHAPDYSGWIHHLFDKFKQRI